MAVTTESIRAATLKEAGSHMADLIDSALSAGRVSRGRWLRLVVDLPTVDPLAWLENQSAENRIYWSDRGGESETAGVGVADRLVADERRTPVDVLAELGDQLSQEGEPLKYFGGYRFYDGQPEGVSDWSDFGVCRFVLPRFELSRIDGRCCFVCNLRPGRDQASELKAGLNQLTWTVSNETPTVPKTVGRADLPEYPEWETTTNVVLDAFTTGELSKAVMARRTTITFDDDIDPVRLLRRLKQRSVGCFYFCFQFSGAAFIGASPERLYLRRGRHIQTEAVAGTRPRGSTEDEDGRLARELLANEKELAEHRFVLDDVTAVLKKVCRRWNVVNHGADSLLKLARVQHLITRLEGELTDGQTDSSVLTMLHPTSAVGGVPIEIALPLIEKLEPFDRGWYSGPVGWIGREGADLAVAIRSGLVTPRRLHLYSGAGIVPGSTAASEWTEIESKLAGFLAALE